MQHLSSILPGKSPVFDDRDDSVGPCKSRVVQQNIVMRQIREVHHKKQGFSRNFQLPLQKMLEGEQSRGFPNKSTKDRERLALLKLESV